MGSNPGSTTYKGVRNGMLMLTYMFQMNDIKESFFISIHGLSTLWVVHLHMIKSHIPEV